MFAQTNLVMNPSFETNYNYCSGPYFNLDQGVLLPWRNGLKYVCNTIYRNECMPYLINNGDTLYEVPWYAGVGYQYARTGKALINITTSQRMGSCPVYLFSHYARGKLSQQMVAGKHYYCGFYINYSNFNSFICNNFGMYLSNDTLPQYQYMQQTYDSLGCSEDRLIPEVPQVNNPPGRSLYDTLNWLLIADTIVAVGGEQYLFLGQFDDGNPIDSGHTGFTGTTYLGNYYGYREQSAFNIDDVFVIDLDTVVGIKQEEVTAYYSQTQNELNITLPTPHALQSIKLLNSNGQEVYNKQYSPPSGKSRVPLPPLPNGIYITELTTVNGYKVHKKIVLQNLE